MQKYKSYVGSVGAALPEILSEAIKKREAAQTPSRKEFAEGYIFGLNTIISLMAQMARANDVSLKEIGIDENTHPDFLR